MKLQKTAILTILLAMGATAKAQLVINEIMQSNIDCIMDDLNDFPDSWVELYNAGTADVQLSDYKLGIKDKADKAWQLPSQTVKAGTYVTVFCDKVGSKLHTDYRLESGKGCEVYLFKGSELTDQVSGLKKQPAPNIAYGRKTDGGTEWGYQLTPTPGKTNCGRICDEKHILGEPVFSEKGRVITGNAAISLALTLPEGSPEGTEIRYTIDGSEPTAASNRYSSPISFSSTRVVRAKLFCDGWLSPRSTTQSFIFFPRKMTLPVIAINTDNKYLNDNKIGIYVDGNYESGKKNYEHDWRRPINIEYFAAEKEASQLNQLCETRIAGGATRGNKFKTLVVYANKRFGTKRLEYEFFPDQRPGVKNFKSIMLRNAGNDFDGLYMRDAIIQRTMASHVDLDWQAWRPAIIYINGVYKGILNIRERSNEDNIFTNYYELEDLDMFENWWELKEGTWDNYNKFKAFYTEHGHTMAEYEQWMDCYEFINLMVMNLYYNNQDFPGNNIVMWRPTAEGGRWRWIAKDTDFGLGLYNKDPNFKTIDWLNNPNYDTVWANWANQYDHTRLFRRLMEDADFKREFIDRAAIYMGDFLNEQGTRAVWDPMYELIKDEYPSHRALINQWWPNYNEELTNAQNWLKQRTGYAYQHLGSYYALGTPIPMTVNKGLTNAEEGGYTFNGVRLSKGTFDGKFYLNRKITIEAEPTANVTGWEVVAGGTAKEYSGSQLELTMPQCSVLAITAILGSADGISNIQEEHHDNDVYDLNGRKVRTGTTSLEGLPSGIYVVGGRKVVK